MNWSFDQLPNISILRYILACEQALRGALAAAGEGGRRAGHYVSGIWIPPSLNSPVAPHRLSCQIFANQRKAETRANVNTPLLMSSPPTSISHCLFRCRYSNSRDAVSSSPFIPTPPPERPGELARRLDIYSHNVLPTMFYIHINIYPCTFLGCRVSVSSLVLISLFSAFVGK